MHPSSLPGQGTGGGFYEAKGHADADVYADADADADADGGEHEIESADPNARTVGDDASDAVGRHRAETVETCGLMAASGRTRAGAGRGQVRFVG